MERSLVASDPSDREVDVDAVDLAEGVVSLAVRQRVRRSAFAAFEEWSRGISKALHEEVEGHLSTTVLRPAPGGNEFIVLVRFASANARQTWEQSPVRANWLQKREPFLEAEPRIEIQESKFGDDWEVFLGPAPTAWPEDVELGRVDAPPAGPRGPRHGPPCKFRLLLIVWMSAIFTSIVMAETVVPLFKKPLMDAVGMELFPPCFSAAMISCVMPVVFLILVPIISTYVCPDFVRRRPPASAFGTSRTGKFCYWFWVG